MNEKIYVLIPNGLSKGIIESQICNKADFYFKKKFKTIQLATSSKNKIILNRDVLIYKSIFIFLFKLPKRSCIYTRSVFEFYKIFIISNLLLKKTYIIYDYRGIISSENYFKNKNKIKFYFLKLLETLPAKFASEIHTVSIKYSEKLQNEFNIKKIKVIPCLTTEVKKFTVTKHDKIKFLYVGGMSKWQNIDDIINTYKKFHDKLNCSFTIITNEKENAVKILKKYPSIPIDILAGDNNFVLNIISNYDIGFLFRDDIDFNNVASPVKFLEYICNGVVPFLTKNIGDYSDFVQTQNIGYIKENLQNLNFEDLIIKKGNLQKLQTDLDILTWDKFDEDKYLKLMYNNYTK
jgi:glycosyltransferase involved in cell wall biosynthesis